MALRIDTAVRHTKKDSWVGNPFKEKEVLRAIWQETQGHEVDLDALIELNQVGKLQYPSKEDLAGSGTGQETA